MILLWNVQKKMHIPPKRKLVLRSNVKKTCTSWTQNQWFWILCRPIIYIYIYIDSKVIYVPLFEYMYFALFCVLSISNIENIAFKWTHDDDCFFGIYATLLRLKCIKPPYAQITMFAKENQLYGYTNPTRMFESITASCHLTFITCLLLFGNYITFANFLTIRIFHCKSPHLTEKVGCGGWA